MSPTATLLLAFGMSIDAFVAALGKGAALRRPSFLEALRTGAIFGGVETITPLLGWAVGFAFSALVTALDHWIALVLLGFVGGRMILHAWTRTAETPRQDTHSFRILVLTAVGTSIDAMAVGVSLAFLDANIIVAAVAIGLMTFAMSTGGMLAGRFIGDRFGRAAEILGGIGLIGLGLSIFIEHMFGG